MFDGNGNWTSDFSAQADRDNGIKILASRFDNIFIADIKESFENCLTKDGQIAPIGNFNMGGQKITNVANGTNDGDAVNKSQIDNLQTEIDTKANASDVVNLTEIQTISGQKTFSSVAYGTASDANNSILTTVAKNKASEGYFKLGNGLIIQWGRFTNTNNTFTVTLPTPFTTNNYSIAYGCLDSQRSGDNTITTNTTSTTNFTGWISCHSTNLQSQWVAIGY